jgi:hypothetical protein
VRLDDLVAAMRAAQGEDPRRSEATQLRLRRSLDARARGHHRLMGILTAVGVLSGGTISWALATGQIAGLWAPVPAAESAVAPLRPTAPGSAPQPSPVEPAAVPEPPAIAVVPPAPEVAPPAPEVAPPAPEVAPRAPEVAPRAPEVAPRALRRASLAAPVEALYRRAHELHFHGGDLAVTLAAWDAYLAAEPAGRFSVEARYNRALVLVRLGRYAGAHAALVPFARGEVALAGYRQAEAAALVERLAGFASQRTEH